MARITTTALALAMTITAAGGAAAAEFSVLTYNVRGLPPLVIEDRTAEIAAIADPDARSGGLFDRRPSAGRAGSDE